MNDIKIQFFSPCLGLKVTGLVFCNSLDHYLITVQISKYKAMDPWVIEDMGLLKA